jgi:hypothetical protein
MNFPRLVLIKEKLPCPSDKIPQVIKMVRRIYADSAYGLERRREGSAYLMAGYMCVGPTPNQSFG